MRIRNRLSLAASTHGMNIIFMDLLGTLPLTGTRNQQQFLILSPAGWTLSVNRASKEYNIPRRTLRYHIWRSEREKAGMSVTLTKLKESE